MSLVPACEIEGIQNIKNSYDLPWQLQQKEHCLAWCVILPYVTLLLLSITKSALATVSSVLACLLALPFKYTCIE